MKEDAMNYIDITERDIKIQQEMLEQYQAQLESLPEGKLHCKMMRGTLRYFRWDQNHKVQQYIKKKDAHFI